MASNVIEELKNGIDTVRYNPAAIQRRALEMLDSVSNGDVTVVDPSNPFTFLLECGSVLASATMDENANNLRKQYPSMAQTEDELYLHMSDEDFIGRFSSPSLTTFTLLFNKAELIQKAVATGDATGTRKLVIPRNTEFMVSDYTFTMEYPIEMRVMAHGGLQIVYNADQPSPLQTLTSNIVDWETVKMRGEDYIRLRVPVNQFKVKSYIAHLTQSTNYSKKFDLVDDFYYCRAYRNTDTGWEEIRTTHTEQVYDPNNPTVVLKVLENKLQVTVPLVYISNKTLDTEVRFDIYTTKGKLDLTLDSYAINAFAVNWRDIGQGIGTYTAPLQTFSAMAVYSDTTVSGGSDGLTFDQLRERVLTNALGNAQLPITNVQLSARLANAGYEAIKDVDNVTNRIFLACRRLPAPSSGATVSGASAMVATLQGTFKYLKDFTGVIDNGDLLTLTSDIFYYRENGVTQILSNQKRQSIEALTGQDLINAVNDNELLTCPFHYVLDATGSYFTSRSYYMDAPAIQSRQFIEANGGLSLSIGTGSVSVYKKDWGYSLQIVTQSDATVQALDDGQVGVQLSYRPTGETRDVFLTGTFVQRQQSEWVFKFDIKSQFAINSKHQIDLTNFILYPNKAEGFVAELVEEFNLVYYILDDSLTQQSQPLSYKGEGQVLGSNAVGATHEKVKVKFGQRLNGFWENSRSVISSAAYRKYAEDVPALYEDNVYERDPDTGTIKVSLDANNNLQYTVLHKKGDPVLDSNGDPVIKHHAGDTMLDADNKPIIESTRAILREFDLFVYDAKYRFTTNVTDQNYLQELPQTLVGWLNNDLSQFDQWALEQTKIYLYPLRTMGTAEAVVGEGVVEQVELEQSMTVTFYLSRNKYDDEYVRQTLTDLAVSTIAAAFTKARVTINNIESKLTEQAGDDAIAIDVAGLGGDTNIQALTLSNNSERLAIAKKFERDMDGSLRVVDGIDVVFLQHEDSA